MVRRSKRRSSPEDNHVDETWLIPYADLLTLLLALFIVLFAMSSIDAKKFEHMMKQLNAAFTGGTGLFQNSNPIPIQEEITLLETINGGEQLSEQERKFRQETEELRELKEQLDAYIGDTGLVDKLQVIVTDDGLMITILDNALYASGSAQVRPEAKELGVEIAKLLVTHPRQVTVSGHTDNVPINNREFPSNWDLSSKRALNFMKILLENPQLNPTRFSATGYGEYRPIASNDTPEGRAKNRRVEVSILRNTPKQQQ